MFTRVNPCTMLKVNKVFFPVASVCSLVVAKYQKFFLSSHRLKEVDSGSSWTVTTPSALWVSLADQ